ncbi:early nodulin-like protein 2 [Iris pallida]|uniref:Early nodulin-like protein 2 n=1 Tax=Iris pallida TaxID=29817 RepID=A0AAX6IB16_IRIPA|nr:early nodulin-like protein 2 [Iris pallida]
MMLYLDEISPSDTAPRPPASSGDPPARPAPHPDLRLLRRPPLFAVGILLFMVAFVRDRDFQAFFAKGWSSSTRRRGMARPRRAEARGPGLDWPRQLVGDSCSACPGCSSSTPGTRSTD